MGIYVEISRLQQTRSITEIDIEPHAESVIFWVRHSRVFPLICQPSLMHSNRLVSFSLKVKRIKGIGNNNMPIVALGETLIMLFFPRVDQGGFVKQP